MQRSSQGFGRGKEATMRRLAASVAVSSLVIGCGFSSAEVRVGDSLKLDVHRATTGKTAVALTVRSREAQEANARCRSLASLAVSWADGSAQVRAC
jgi:hypothetical protein